MSFARMFRIYYKNVPAGEYESERSGLPHIIVDTSVYEILSNLSFDQTKNHLHEHGGHPSYWTADEISAICDYAVTVMENVAVDELLKYREKNWRDTDSHSYTVFLERIHTNNDD
jgi:hypothetical protein